MDRANVPPRYFVGNRQNHDLSASASGQGNKAVVLGEQEQINQIAAGHNATVIKLDFKKGAKVYKKRLVFGAFYTGFKVAATLTMITVFILGAFGIWLNYKYAGRALPFSYVGGISVGGLTQSEIKQALDARSKELKVTFIDGGLTRTVPASLFGANFDTETASKQSISSFNPFTFLDRRTIEVPVKINDFQVEGYMRLNVHPGQTGPSDAQIVKDKTKLAVKAPIMGFRSDPKFVANNVRLGLAGMQSPVVNVNAATLKPKITEADLADDVIKANNLLGTNITISYGRYVQVITPAQKMAWVEFNESGGAKDVQISFSRSLIRQYVLDLAKKYQKPALVVTPVAVTDPTAVAAPITPTEVIDNIEQVTDAVVAGLNSGQTTTSKFVATKAQAVPPVAELATPSGVANR